jgi:hypothetical protein
MKIRKLLPYLLIIASSASIFAAPSEINYQGVLTDQQGNPINGVRAMQIKLYDSPTGGTLLYSEDLGNVPVQDGVYSFNFGANGTSNAITTETIATANGTSSTFQKVLTASTVIAGSISVTDGIYTWDQTNGSSNESEFGVSYSSSLRRVTVTYYNGAPAAGKTISAKFRAPGSGIAGALAEDKQPWIEVSLAGVTQTPRQKVLTVPFALNSNRAEFAQRVEIPNYNIIFQPTPSNITVSDGATGTGTPVTWNMYSQKIYIPPDTENLNVTIDANVSLKLRLSTGGGFSTPLGPYTLDISIFLGTTEIHKRTISGTFPSGVNYNSSQNLSIKLDAKVNVKSLGIVTGFSDLLVKITKKDYTSSYRSDPNYATAPAYTDIGAGTCSMWLISSPN